MGGRGFLTMPGDGRLFTMAAGMSTPIGVPFGFRITNGDRDGLPGEGQEIFMDGHPSDLASVLPLLTGEAMNCLTISGLLYEAGTSAEGISTITMSAEQTTSRSSTVRQ